MVGRSLVHISFLAAISAIQLQDGVDIVPSNIRHIVQSGKVVAPNGSLPNITCPAGFHICPSAVTCCPTGIQCDADNFCDISCTDTDIPCPFGGCCPPGFACDLATQGCIEGSGTGSKPNVSTTVPPLPKTTNATSTTTTSTSTPKPTSGDVLAVEYAGVLKVVVPIVGLLLL